ncbi:PH domain-containing protein [Streptomyces sp. NPDC048448]|uniref:PH domain-containing protein n=1 Tax=unclassified Streptomyces TaxID=2593676 RepID=UPI0037129FB9
MQHRRPQRVSFGIILIVTFSALQIFAQQALWHQEATLRLAALTPLPLIFYFSLSFYLRPSVTVTRDALVVRNLFTVYEVPYKSVVACGGRRALTLEVSNYGHLPVLAYDTSITGRKQRDALAQEISARKVNADNSNVRFSKRYVMGIAELLCSGTTILLCAVSFALLWTRG